MFWRSWVPSCWSLFFTVIVLLNEICPHCFNECLGLFQMSPSFCLLHSLVSGLSTFLVSSQDQCFPYVINLGILYNILVPEFSISCHTHFFLSLGDLFQDPLWRPALRIVLNLTYTLFFFFLLLVHKYLCDRPCEVGLGCYWLSDDTSGGSSSSWPQLPGGNWNHAKQKPQLNGGTMYL